jgi:general secretion pathway protein G
MSVDPEQRGIKVIQTIRRLKERRASEEIDGGFTLIELLIVIVVLGILAAVVVLSIGGTTSTSAKAACESDGATYQTAMAAYLAQNGTAATSLGQLSVTPNVNSHYTFNIPTAPDPLAGELTVTPTGGTEVAYTGTSSCNGVS